MTAPRFQIQLYSTTGSGPPPTLAAAELAFSEADKQLYVGLSDGTIYPFPFIDPTLLPPPPPPFVYHSIVPRALEMDSVNISASGQIYQLSQVPDDRPTLAHVQIHAGYPVSGQYLTVVCEPVGSVQSTPVASWRSVGDAVTGFFGAPFQSRADLFIPTTDGRIYMRRVGDYLNASNQTDLWVRGWFEGLQIEEVS